VANSIEKNNPIKQLIFDELKLNPDSLSLFLEVSYLILLKNDYIKKPSFNLEDFDTNYKDKWVEISKLISNFSGDELKNLIKDIFFDFENRNFDVHSTKQLNQIVYSLLGLDKTENNKIIDAFSSRGDFLITVLSPDFQDGQLQNCIYACNLNRNNGYISRLIADIFGNGSTVVEVIDDDDCFSNLSNIEFNRARIFGPLGIKSKARTLKSSTRLFDEIPNKTILNSEWEYIDAMFQKDIVDFRAVALVTGKNLWDSQTEAYRKSFIKSGYLEGIIELPQKALPNTGVHLFLLVLSNQNKQVKLLDASELIIKNKNRFSEYERVANLDIGGILDQYFDDRCVKSIEEVLRFKNLTPSITNVKKKEIQNGVRLSDIAYVFTGNQYTIKNFSGMLSDVETGYSILTSNDITDFYINLSSLRHINYGDGKLDKYAIQNGDVIVTSKSSKVKVGVVDFEPKERIIVTGGMIIIRPNKEKLNPIYLKAFLDSELGQQELRMIQKGSIIVSINAKDLSNIDVPYLDIKKQEQIANSYQNNVSSLIALKEEAREIENKLKNILDERKAE
jgi:hypothetical protein